jgi:hypothetical protein
MVNYSCNKCGKEFFHKGNYTKHMNKKKSCIIENVIEPEIKSLVGEKIGTYIENEIKMIEPTINNEINVFVEKVETIFEPIVKNSEEKVEPIVNKLEPIIEETKPLVEPVVEPNIQK